MKEGKQEKGLTGKRQGPYISPAKTISIFSLYLPNSATPFVLFVYHTADCIKNNTNKNLQLFNKPHFKLEIKSGLADVG